MSGLVCGALLGVLTAGIAAVGYAVAPRRARKPQPRSAVIPPGRTA